MMRSRVIAAVAAVAASAVGVASASVLVPDGSDTPNGPDFVQPDGQGSKITARTADPDGGPDWAVRTYTSMGGATCSQAGRFVDGVFGAVDSNNGQLRPLSVQAAGACSILDEQPYSLAISTYRPAEPSAATGVVFGAVNASVTGVALSDRAGTRKSDISGGSFVFVAPRSVLDTATVTFSTGKDVPLVISLARRPGAATP